MRAWWGTGLGLNTGDSGGGGGGRSARKLNLSDRFSAAHFIESAAHFIESEQERRAHDRQVGLTSGSSRSSAAVAVASRSTRSMSSRAPVRRREGTPTAAPEGGRAVLAEVRGIWEGGDGRRSVTAWVRVRAAFGYSVFIRETTSVVRAAWF